MSINQELYKNNAITTTSQRLLTMAQLNPNSNNNDHLRQIDYEEFVRRRRLPHPDTPSLEPTRSTRRAEYDQLMSLTQNLLQPVTIVDAMLKGQQTTLLGAWDELQRHLDPVGFQDKVMTHYCIAFRSGRYACVQRGTRRVRTARVRTLVCAHLSS